MMSYQGRLFGADTLTDLVEVVIPGYLDGVALDDPATPLALLEKRMLYLGFIAQIAQAAHLLDAVTTSPGGASDGLTGEQQAVLAAQRGLLDLALWQEGEDVNRLLPVYAAAEWDWPIPLVCLASAYTGGAVPPVGNVILLDPADERTLLDSLAAVGVIEWGIRDDDVD
jgi:hypothetical protein